MNHSRAAPLNRDDNGKGRVNGKMGNVICSRLPSEGTCCSYETELELKASRGMKSRAWNVMDSPNITGSP